MFSNPRLHSENRSGAVPRHWRQHHHAPGFLLASVPDVPTPPAGRVDERVRGLEAGAAGSDARHHMGGDHEGRDARVPRH